MKKGEIIAEVLSKGYFATVKENWQKVRGKGLKSKLRFTVGLVLFTIGFVFLRCWQAISETMLDIMAWLENRKKDKK